MDIDTAMAGVQMKMKGTPEFFQQILDGARQMSTELPASTADILDLVKTAGQLGVAGEDALGFAKTMIQMAQTTDMTAEQAAKSISGFANIVGASTKEFANIGSTILALEGIGRSEASNITDMAVRIAAAGATARMHTPDILAFANAMVNLNLEPEAGGTAFSKTVISINEAVMGLAPSAETLEQIAQANLKVRDSGDALVEAQRSVRDAHEEVADAGRGVRDANEAVSDANLDLEDAYKNLADAQRDQVMASIDTRRETLSLMEAQQRLDEVLSRAPSLALDMKAAQIGVAEAQERLNKARRDGKPNDVVRAELNLAQAYQRMNQLAVQQRGYQLDVQRARLGVVDAISQQGATAKRAAEDEDRAQRQVTQAERNKRNAIEGTNDAKRRQRDAYEGVDEANKKATRSSDQYASAQKLLNGLTDSANNKLGKYAKLAGMSREAFADLFNKNSADATLAVINGLARIDKEGGNVYQTLRDLGIQEVREIDALTRLARGQNSVADGAIKIEDHLRVAREEYPTTNQLTRQSGIANETLASQMQMLNNSMTNNASIVGGELVPMLKQFITDVQPVVNLTADMAMAFASLPGPVQMIVVGLVGFAAVIGPLIGSIGLLALAFGGLSISLGPLLLVIGAITLAVVAAYVAWKNWDKIVGLVNGVKDGVLDALGDVLGFLKNNWPEVASLISGPFFPLVALATDAFGIRSALEDAFGSVLDFLGGAWKGVKDLVVAPFNAALDSAKGGFGIPGALKSAFNGAKDFLTGAGKDVINGLIRGIKDALPNLKDVLGGVKKLIPNWKGPPEEDRKLLYPAGQLIMEGLANGLAAGWAPVQTQLSGYSAAIGDMTQDWMAPNITRSSFGGIRAGAGSGPAGDAANNVLAPIGGRAAGGIVVNSFGPIEMVPMKPSQGLRTIGWGVQEEMQRRGAYI
jgi:TP901 family phage tail tape measure protein